MGKITKRENIEFITRADAATILGRDIRTVDRYRHRGDLTTYQRPGGGGVQLDKAEVEKLARPVPIGAGKGAD